MRILPKGPPPPAAIVNAWSLLGKQPITGEQPEIISQSIILTALNDSIPNLGVVAWLDGTGPMHPTWHMPEMSIETEKDYVRSKIGQSPRYITLVKNDQIPLLIWFATRTSNGDEEITFNVDPPITQKLKDLKEPFFIDIDLLFIPVDKDRRKFRLQAKSWDELNLINRV